MAENSDIEKLQGADDYLSCMEIQYEDVPLRTRSLGDS